MHYRALATLACMNIRQRANSSTERYRPYPQGCSVQVRSHKSGTKRFLVHIVA